VFLRSIGCEYAQGYHFGEPIPERDVIQLLKMVRRSERRLQPHGFFRPKVKPKKIENTPASPVSAGSESPTAASAALAASSQSKPHALPARTVVRARHKPSPVPSAPHKTPLGLSGPTQRDSAMAFAIPPMGVKSQLPAAQTPIPAQRIQAALANVAAAPMQRPQQSAPMPVQQPASRMPPPPTAQPSMAPARPPLSEALARALPPSPSFVPPPLPSRAPEATQPPDFSKLPPGVAASLARLAAGARGSEQSHEDAAAALASLEKPAAKSGAA
jgi:hypothetical protein